jgi:hypothetical protein
MLTPLEISKRAIILNKRRRFLTGLKTPEKGREAVLKSLDVSAQFIRSPKRR